MLASCNGCDGDPELFKLVDEPCFVNAYGELIIGNEALSYEIGICRVGHTIQVQDGRLACDNSTGPRIETCNNLDDDCDGVVDDPVNLKIAPWLKENECKQCGKCSQTWQVCTNGEWVCEYENGPPSSDDNCNGVDDDCDCRTDEDFELELRFCYTYEDQHTALCGECRIGYEKCVNGEVECHGEIHPRDEVCNNLDDDCDCIVDNTDFNQSKADIVFEMDTSGSMAGTIEDVREAMCMFAQSEDSDTYRFALVLIATPDNSFSLAKNLGTAQELCEALEEVQMAGSYEPTISSTAAILDENNPLMLNWREDARKVVVGFGDEGAYATECGSDPTSNAECIDAMVEEIMARCDDEDASVFWFQTDAEYYQDIAYACSGNFFYLYPNEDYIVDSLNQMFQEICI